VTRGETGRAERLAILTAQLVAHPARLFRLDELATSLGVARSTASEDLALLGSALARSGLGRVNTVQGARGGVRYVPEQSAEAIRDMLTELSAAVKEPARVLPGGFLYLTDLVCSPVWAAKMGNVFAQAWLHTAPTHVLTVETKGIPVALMTARALGVPLLVARRDARVTEGPAVSITYLSGTTGLVQAMSLPRRALAQGSAVLIVDDFMRGGTTAKGLVDLAGEFGARVCGVGVAIAMGTPAVKRVSSYLPLLVLSRVDEGTRWIELEPNLTLALARPT
jgi:purine operon repressor